MYPAYLSCIARNRANKFSDGRIGDIDGDACGVGRARLRGDGETDVPATQRGTGVVREGGSN